MPIQIQHTAPGVYLAIWTGEVTVDDFLHGMETVGRYAEEYDEFRYVIVVDLTDCIKLPMDMRNFTSAISRDQRYAGAVAVNAPTLARLIGAILGRLMPHPMLFADTRDEAYALAENIIAPP